VPSGEIAVTTRFHWSRTRHDPWWDLEGSDVRRRRRFRAVEAMLAWAALASVAMLALAGPASMSVLV
jgi:hypothetical protein